MENCGKLNPNKWIDKPMNADSYGWKDFVKWGVKWGISFEFKHDWKSWWDCWKAGYFAGIKRGSQK